MNDSSGKILLSRLFLISLFLLLLNDFYLKAEFHNFLTGKLSDFAGLFVFSLFFIAFFPNRKLLILVFTAIFFAFWKSSFSENLIQYWNSFDLIPIWRAVDYTDLIALLVLPFAYFYSKSLHSFELDYSFFKVIAVRFIILISLFAFVATSYADEHGFWIKQRYELNLIRPQFEYLLRQNPNFENLTIQHGSQQTNSNMKQYEGYVFFSLNHKICDSNYPRIALFYKDLGMQILIENVSIDVNCQAFVSENRNAAIQNYEPIVKDIFEREIIEYLQQNSSKVP